MFSFSLTLIFAAILVFEEKVIADLDLFIHWPDAALYLLRIEVSVLQLSEFQRTSYLLAESFVQLSHPTKFLLSSLGDTNPIILTYIR